MVSERPAWAKWGVLSQCQLHSKTLSQKQATKTKTVTLSFPKKIKDSPRGEALLRGRPDLVLVRGSIWECSQDHALPAGLIFREGLAIPQSELEEGTLSEFVQMGKVAP